MRASIPNSSEQTDLGFAGFRVFKAPELARRDIVHSWRELFPRGGQHLSVRFVRAWLAIDTYTDSWKSSRTSPRSGLKRRNRANPFTVYALLDSASVTGAYKFVVHCEQAQVIMDVENHIYARKDIKQLGIAPMTSMFSCGNERRVCDTIHPQIHDSDRLAMWLGNGEWICRPLNNPQKLQFNAYQDKNPKGFGLLQLDRDFTHYQDVMGWYNKRPSLWVEPRNHWGKGAVSLMEIPTTGETLDNIVCFWQPEKPMKAGDTWTSAICTGARCRRSFPAGARAGHAYRYGQLPGRLGAGRTLPGEMVPSFRYRFVGGDLKAAAPKGIEPVITLSSGEAKQIEILYVEPFDGYRILFDWYPTPIRPTRWICAVPALSGRCHQRNLAVSILPAGAGQTSVR
jgi:glucan biosynthesis protein